MEKQFRVSLWEEIGGFVHIMAETAKEAEEKAQQILDEKGIQGFIDFDTTHRETDIIDVENDED